MVTLNAPNTKLTGWFELSGLSQKELARQVIRRAHARGERHLCTDASRVHHWFAGQQPRHPVPGILSEIFTERFGHPVTIEDLGLQHEKSAIFHQVDLPWDLAATVSGIDQFTRSDLMLNRRDVVAETISVVTGAALIAPLQSWLTSVPNIPSGKTGKHRIGASDVEKIEQITYIFRHQDNQQGGGLLRKSVVAYLNEINNIVDTASYTEHVGCRLLSAVSDLAHLAGWMSHDAGLHATGQRYFILGIHAAKEADNRPLAANNISCIARQMNYLDRPSDAVELFRLAGYGSRNTASSAFRAMLHAEEAGVLAKLGRIQDCYRSIDLAQEIFSEVRSDEEPDWLDYFDAAEIAAATGIAYRNLAYHDFSQTEEAEMCLRKAMTLRRPDYVRSYALDLTDLISIQISAGKFEMANENIGQMVELSEQLISTRIYERLKALRRRVNECKTTSIVREIQENLTAIV